MSFIYLASPYSDPDPFVREQRYLDVLQTTAELLNKQRWVYSPIVHCHELAKVAKMPTDAKFWEDYNHTMIEAADALVVMQLTGWRLSLGVTEEIEFATSLGKRIEYL